MYVLTNDNYNALTCATKSYGATQSARDRPCTHTLDDESMMKRRDVLHPARVAHLSCHTIEYSPLTKGTPDNLHLTDILLWIIRIYIQFTLDCQDLYTIYFNSIVGRGFTRFHLYQIYITPLEPCWRKKHFLYMFTLRKQFSFSYFQEVCKNLHISA